MSIELYKVDKKALQFVKDNYPEQTELVHAIDFFEKCANQNDIDMDEFNKACEVMESTLYSKEFKFLADDIMKDPASAKRASELGYKAMDDINISRVIEHDPSKITNDMKDKSGIFKDKNPIEYSFEWILNKNKETIQSIANSINNARKTVDNTVHNAINVIKQGGQNMSIQAKQLALNSVKYTVQAAANLEHSLNKGIKRATTSVKQATKVMGDAIKNAPINVNEARLSLMNGLDSMIMKSEKEIMADHSMILAIDQKFEKALTSSANAIESVSKGIREGLSQVSEEFNIKIIEKKYDTSPSSWRFTNAVIDLVKQSNDKNQPISYKDAEVQVKAQWEASKAQEIQQRKTQGLKGPGPIAKGISKLINTAKNAFNKECTTPQQAKVNHDMAVIKSRQSAIDARNQAKAALDIQKV